MAYDFDRVIDRRNSGSLKWDYSETQGSGDFLPMWVADMDFESPREIIDAITERAKHGVFGYTSRYDSYCEAVKGWMDRRHGWEIKKEWIISTPGVVPALSLAMRAYTRPGDKVVVQSPVYHLFYPVIKSSGREVVESRLKLVGNRYEMDYENLDRVLDEGAGMLILCSPHNPVGRVWEEDELRELARICINRDVLIISDEIHSDLIMEGYKHTSMACLSDEIADRTVTCTSASKTFNLAGLACANIIIPNKEFRDQFDNVCRKLWIGTPNIFGLIATEAGYRYGEEWLEHLLGYLKGNYDFLVSYLNKELPMIRTAFLEGTYLAWLDFSALGLAEREIDELLLKDAGVQLDNGSKFGSGGEGFQRINLACPKSVLKEGLDRIGNTVKWVSNPKDD